jgi:putative ABC transport system substrate-binding protein
MNRRDTLLALLALGAAAGPRVATSQASTKMPALGYLTLVEASTQGPWDQTSLAVELKKLGWVEGKNIRIERAYADRKYERLSVLAADLVRMKVDLIYAVGPYPALAAAKATKTIPIVFFGPTFPVEMGLVDSYARPGRNATGAAWSAGIDVYVKLIEFVKQLAPAATRIAYLRPRSPAGDHIDSKELARQLEFLQQLVSAAKKMRLEMRGFDVSRPEDFDPAFRAIQAWRAQALYSHQTPITSPEIQRIIDFANANRIPSFFDARAFANAGGLLTYGPEVSQLVAQSVGHVDRILRGAKPADLPVEMPTRYELFVNGKTAKTLGLTIPQSILARADQVIQ